MAVSNTHAASSMMTVSIVSGQDETLLRTAVAAASVPSSMVRNMRSVLHRDNQQGRHDEELTLDRET